MAGELPFGVSARAVGIAPNNTASIGAITKIGLYVILYISWVAYSNT